MNTPRFEPGRLGAFDGIDFRISKGKKPVNGAAPDVAAAHPDGDLVMEWNTPNSGWTKVSCHPLFLLVDFIAWNEDYLYPQPQFRGGDLILEYLHTARVSGHGTASQQLTDDRAPKNPTGTPTTYCQFCHRMHDVPDELCEWDWAGIRNMERAAKAKGARLPKCRVCGQPMWLGQVGTHHSCREEGRA